MRLPILYFFIGIAFLFYACIGLGDDVCANYVNHFSAFDADLQKAIKAKEMTQLNQLSRIAETCQKINACYLQNNPDPVACAVRLVSNHFKATLAKRDSTIPYVDHFDLPPPPRFIAQGSPPDRSAFPNNQNNPEDTQEMTMIDNQKETMAAPVSSPMTSHAINWF